MPLRCGLMLSLLPLVCVLLVVTSTRCETAPSSPPAAEVLPSRIYSGENIFRVRVTNASANDE